MDDLMPLRRPSVPLDSVLRINLQLPRLRQCHTNVENYDLIFSDDRNLKKDEEKGVRAEGEKRKRDCGLLVKEQTFAGWQK